MKIGKRDFFPLARSPFSVCRRRSFSFMGRGEGDKEGGNGKSYDRAGEVVLNEKVGS